MLVEEEKRERSVLTVRVRNAKWCFRWVLRRGELEEGVGNEVGKAER